MAKPVTSPDSARATDPRATETVLELRLLLLLVLSPAHGKLYAS